MSGVSRIARWDFLHRVVIGSIRRRMVQPTVRGGLSAAHLLALPRMHDGAGVVRRSRHVGVSSSCESTAVVPPSPPLSHEAPGRRRRRRMRRATLRATGPSETHATTRHTGREERTGGQWCVCVECAHSRARCRRTDCVRLAVRVKGGPNGAPRVLHAAEAKGTDRMECADERWWRARVCVQSAMLHQWWVGWPPPLSSPSLSAALLCSAALPPLAAASAAGRCCRRCASAWPPRSPSHSNLPRALRACKVTELSTHLRHCGTTRNHRSEKRLTCQNGLGLRRVKTPRSVRECAQLRLFHARA